MQRSRSSSNIPLAIKKTTLSSESLKDSQAKLGLRRSNSSSQLFHPSRVSSSNIRNEPSSATKPISHHYKRSTAITTTPTHRVPGVGRFPSAATSLSAQKINDKKFILDQFRKNCSFLESRIDDFDPKYVKTLTIESFVHIVTLLFNEIDPRIQINKLNYKETIFKYMKLYKYPGNLSISMLKSANTSLSWAPIMSMFGWLIDLINYSDSEEYQDEKLRKYIAVGSMKKFRGIEMEKSNENYLDEIVGLDRNEYRALISECQQLEEDKTSKTVTSENLKSEENELSEKYERMKFEIEEYRNGYMEARIKKEISDLQAEGDMKGKKIEEIKCDISRAKEIISSQEYSLDDKKKLEKELLELQFSVKLKKEKLESIKKFNDEYDYKQTSARREIEVKIHDINDRLLQLKPALINIKSKKIQLPDRGIHSQQFLEAVKEKIQLIHNVREKVDIKLSVAKNDLDRTKNEYNVISNEVNEKEKELASNKEHLEKIHDEMNRVAYESEILEQQIEKKIATLIEIAPDVELIKKKNFELKKERNSLLKEIEDYSNESISIFKKVYEDATVDGAEMRNMMNHIYEKCLLAFEHFCKETEAASEVLDHSIPPPHGS